VQLPVVYSVYINVNWGKPIVILSRYLRARPGAMIHRLPGVQFVLDKWGLYFT